MLLDTELIILGASDGFVTAAGMRRDAIVGRAFFEVFTDDPAHRKASILVDLAASFQRVLGLKRPDVMPLQRCDAGDPDAPKFWKPVNKPVLGPDGGVKWILHSVEDVTDHIDPCPLRTAPVPASQDRRVILDSLRTANGLLNHLPEPLWELLRDELMPAVLQRGAIITEPGRAAPVVYFPLSGLYSASQYLDDGSAVEVGIGSRTGLIGVSVVSDTPLEHLETRCLIEGSALAIDAGVLRSIMTFHPELRAYLGQILPVLMAQMSLSVACAARHSVEQRLSLWLMRASDSIRSLRLEVPQETLAVLLGVRRSGVSETLSRLADAGLVTTGRGVTAIVDKARLKSRACSCYGEIENLRAVYPFARFQLDPDMAERLPELLQDIA